MTPRPPVIVSPWRDPAPPGIASALDSSSQVAAPLLAGFSATIAAGVAANPTAPSAGYAVLASAVLALGLLVLALEVGVYARSNWAPPSEYVDWHPMARHSDTALDELRRQQSADYGRWLWYQSRGRKLYNAGLLAFLATAALLVLPPETPRVIPDIPVAHYAPVFVAIAFIVVEAWWIASAAYAKLPGRHFFVPPIEAWGVPPAPEGFSKDTLG